jgi:hypothetical protein
MEINNLTLNIPQLKQVVNNSINDLESMSKTEIRTIGLKDKIQNRLETLNKIKLALEEHKDVF